MKVIFRVDASSRMGGGHVMRCLTLANALLEKGARATFVSAAIPPPLAERVRRAGHGLCNIALSEPLAADEQGWELPSLSAGTQRDDARQTLAAIGDEGADWIVVDHYRLGRDWEKAVRPRAGRILVLDDLANRHHDCDLLLDQTLGRASEDYRPLVPARCRVLAGARYALLRPEFTQARAPALERRITGGPVRRLLVSLGGTDLGGITGQVLDALLEARFRCTIDVILNRGAPSLAAVERLASAYPEVNVHVDVTDVARLMSAADVAIGTAGTTSWERCCLGLPTVTLILADNQKLVANNLRRVGAAAVVDGVDAVAPAVRDLISSQVMLQSMIAAAAAIIDGQGIERVAGTIKDVREATRQCVQIRPAERKDSLSIWLWRNDPLTREMAKSHDPVRWDEHAAWFQRCRSSAGCLMFVGEVAGSLIGTIRFNRNEDGSYTVSINVAPEFRGMGLAGGLLREGCSAFNAKGVPTILRAEIRKGNDASERIFLSNGFVRELNDDVGPYLRYVRPS